MRTLKASSSSEGVASGRSPRNIKPRRYSRHGLNAVKARVKLCGFGRCMSTGTEPSGAPRRSFLDADNAQMSGR